MAVISSKNAANAIYLATKDKSGHEFEKSLDLAFNFLIKKNLIGRADEILDHLEKFADDDSGTVRALVTSPHMLSASAVNGIARKLKSRYGAREIIVQTKTDPSLVGGIKIEAKDEVVDLSWSNQLNQLKNYLI